MLLGIPRTLLSAIPNAVDVDRSRAISYSNHGVERETRLELATLTLARYRSNSVFRSGRNQPINDYLPLTSTGLNAGHTGIHADHTGVHTGHKRRLQVGERGTRPRTAFLGGQRLAAKTSLPARCRGTVPAPARGTSRLGPRRQEPGGCLKRVLVIGPTATVSVNDRLSDARG